ncbi:MAG: hypothetical protein K2K78_03400, partial [Muribaculaceae bacterium]|nr:hypothetical protein [Muribaculaceae bacterium]
GNPDAPYEMVLHPTADGDIYGEMGDALIAFNLNGMPGFDETVKIKLRWMSFSGEKSTELELPMRSWESDESLDSSLSGQSARIL